MLAARIIPTLLYKGRSLYKGSGFDAWRQVGVVTQAVRIHQARGVDELIMLDISATRLGNPPDYVLIQELTAGCFMPLTVGGGIYTYEHAKALLDAGADKIALGSALGTRPNLLSEVSAQFGAQAVVAIVEVLNGCATVDAGQTEAPITNPAQWSKRLVSAGAGEIFLSCVERDGTMSGYDLNLIREVCAAVDVPVIASGGCSSYENMLKAIRAGASAVAAGALFQFSDHTPAGAADFLADNGIEVRHVH